MESKAKCPFCGKDFIAESGEKECVCPSCGKSVLTVRAIKYYSSLEDNSTEKKEAHGEDYHKVNLILDAAYDLIGDGKYSEAEEKLSEALDMTDTDYRVYMAMVAAKTKNYTDLDDKTHKAFIDKAIAVADADGKKDITAKYKNYYDKTKLDKSVISEINEEESSLKKNKLEKSLKSLIPEFMAKEKRNKLFVILFPIFFALGALLSVPFIFFEDLVYFSLIGIAFLIVGYVMFRLWFTSRDYIRAFNSLLDLYDLLDGKSLGGEQGVKIYDSMYKIYARFEDKDPLFSINFDTVKLVKLLLDYGDDEIKGFVLSNRYFYENIPLEYVDEEN